MSDAADALARNEVGRHAARHPGLTRQIKAAFLAHLLRHGSADADILHELVAIPPEVSPRVLGVIQQLADSGLIRYVGTIRSRRKRGHAHPHGLWEIADRPAAVAWLGNHPVTPAQSPPTLFPEDQGEEHGSTGGG